MHRVAITDLAVGIGAHLTKTREDLVESFLGDVPRRLLVPGEPAADRAQRHDDVGLDRSVGQPLPDRLAAATRWSASDWPRSGRNA